MNWLHEKDVIERVPSFPTLAPVPRETVGWIDRPMQEKILAKVRPDTRLLFETMMELGCRPGEAVALRVRDLIDGGIRLERALNRQRKAKGTKTGAVRWKVVSAGLFRRLEEASKDRLPEAWLFVNGAGKPFAPSHIAWLWHQAAKSAGVEVCLSVSSRHSRASQRRRELEKQIAETLRAELTHTSSRTTLKHYVRDDREAYGPKRPV